MKGSLQRRALIGGAIWIALALAVGGIVLSELFDDFSDRQFNAWMDGQLTQIVATLAIDGPEALEKSIGDPKFGRPYSGLYWQIENEDGALIRSRSLWDEKLVTPAQAIGASVVLADGTGPNAEEVRMFARAITLRNGRTWRVSVASTLSELRAERLAFRQGLAISLIALGGALIIAGLLQTAVALRPLNGLREAISRYRDGRSARIEGAFPAEVAPLAEDLNEMLDRNARIMERARRQAADLAHALKTPSAILRNELDRLDAAGGATARHARDALDRIDAQTSRHLARARIAAFAAPRGSSAPVHVATDRLVRALGRMYADRDLAVEARVDPEHLFRGEAQDLEELLGALMENACKWARSRVRVSTESAGGALSIRVEDDGDGLPEDKYAEAVQAGVRLDERQPGTGLGLAIATDLVEIYGGKLSLGKSELGGLRVVCAFPAPA